MPAIYGKRAIYLNPISLWLFSVPFSLNIFFLLCGKIEIINKSTILEHGKSDSQENIIQTAVAREKKNLDAGIIRCLFGLYNTSNFISFLKWWGIATNGRHKRNFFSIPRGEN